MDITQTEENGIHVFGMAGRLDSNTSPEFEKKLFNAIGDGAARVVVDCTDLDYISSAGLRVVLKATKELKKKDGLLVLCCMKEYVREVFEIAGFDTFITIVPDLDEAKAQFD
ncbi:MAG: STAS domain-containing protein [Desulfatibacillaceae bacterium]